MLLIITFCWFYGPHLCLSTEKSWNLFLPLSQSLIATYRKSNKFEPGPWWWSSCHSGFLSTLTIRVQIPLKSTVFIFAKLFAINTGRRIKKIYQFYFYRQLQSNIFWSWPALLTFKISCPPWPPCPPWTPWQSSLSRQLVGLMIKYRLASPFSPLVISYNVRVQFDRFLFKASSKVGSCSIFDHLKQWNLAQ